MQALGEYVQVKVVQGKIATAGSHVLKGEVISVGDKVDISLKNKDKVIYSDIKVLEEAGFVFVHQDSIVGKL